MRDSLLKLTKYNVWANDKFIDCLLGVDEGILTTQTKSSFSTILETCKHIWFGELGWMSRMNNQGWQTTEIDNFQGTPSELFSSWQNTSKVYIKFAEEAELDVTTHFVHDDIAYDIMRQDIITTIITHGNYHRGQLVTMLRQLGVEKIPKTDYIEWVREQARED